MEFVRGIVENIKPKLVLVIDSLCSKSVDRISKSIQLSDTGIVPGGGVGNARLELTEETLKVPVVALGIPTVIDAVTLVEDGIDIWLNNLENTKNNDIVEEIIDVRNFAENSELNSIKNALIPTDLNFIVTPKEIDELIENMTEIVACRYK